MEQKLEFCMLGSCDKINFSRLCRQFNISRPVGYKWLLRYEQQGASGLLDKSKRPGRSPGKTPDNIEDYIVVMRHENPEWGSKKIRRILENQVQNNTYPFEDVPCRTTITNILARHGLISPEKSTDAQRWQRFEAESPNWLWQMDFKGPFNLLDNSRCHPLTILDDHSRFNLGLFACKDQRHETVKSHLINVFRQYGLPHMILSDNGSPWGTESGRATDERKAFTMMEKWLIRINVQPIHGHPYHPQTQGKEERFHRTLKTELLNYENFRNYLQCQSRFDFWREKYNCQRPHEAIGLQMPVMRYRTSNRPFPEVLPPIEYNSSDMVRKVNAKGIISFKNRTFKVGKAFVGDPVALRPTEKDGVLDVYFCNQIIRSINLHLKV